MPTDLRVRVTVRYFAAARAAAGAETEIFDLRAGTTVAELIATLKSRDAELANVLARCSYLRDGIAVRDMEIVLDDAQTLDVLPPFAGG
ncbi:MoaD/ThiS family protein [Mycolicibacterium hippocampi]|uniref:Molybdopterin synthase sulfur carrier subunit n=1 Tax=Mycolicibacterium hippocampi TaxID=659824 RepID=A0A850PQV9_9MYCO|nr:MoaD/ThiS family protein [Mycolicibacterium hippocampi]NVN50026.1 Molybdopterin synthase sulfur carrier subunit [Mycolicibacterium hippocampi]